MTRQARRRAATLIGRDRPCARSAPRARRRSQAARLEQHAEVVEQVGGLLAQPLVGLLAAGARRPPRPPPRPSRRSRSGPARKQLGGVAALGHARAAARRACARARAAPRAAPTPRLAERAVEAGALARVAGGAGRLDQRQQRVGVAVVAQRAQPLDVARGLALVPQLLARAAPEVRSRRSRACARAPRGSCRRASAPRPCVQSWVDAGTRPFSSNAIASRPTPELASIPGHFTQATRRPRGAPAGRLSEQPRSASRRCC